MEKLSRRGVEQPRTLPQFSNSFLSSSFRRAVARVCTSHHPSPGHLYLDQTLDGAIMKL